MATHRKTPEAYVNVTFRIPPEDVDRARALAFKRSPLAIKWTALLREATHRGLDLMEAESKAAKKGIL